VWTPLVVMSFEGEKSAEFGKDNPSAGPVSA
jgi:hypothetical protein